MLPVVASGVGQTSALPRERSERGKPDASLGGSLGAPRLKINLSGPTCLGGPGGSLSALRPLQHGAGGRRVVASWPKEMAMLRS